MIDLRAFTCPRCQAPLEVDNGAVTCASGHQVGRVDGGVLDVRRPKNGVEAELVEFWSDTPAYYDEARAANLDYDDPDHAAHRRLLQILATSGAHNVLDVGCGTGEVAEEIAKRDRSIEYVGVDVSPLALQMGVSLGRPGTFVAADADALPLRSDSFDAAISLFALEHFNRPRAAIAEMVRVVRPGGLVALLSLAYDRPLGIVPSIQFGLSGRRRTDPLNVAVYALNRIRFAARQGLKQVRMAVEPRYAPYELVARPLVLDAGYSADLDAVHVVSPRAVLRTLEALGCSVIETSLPAGWRGWVLPPFSFFVVARKGSR